MGTDYIFQKLCYLFIFLTGRSRYRTRDDRRDDRGGRGGSYQWGDKRSSTNWSGTTSHRDSSSSSNRYSRDTSNNAATNSATSSTDQTATYASYATPSSSATATNMTYGGVYPYQNGTTAYTAYHQPMQYSAASQGLLQQPQPPQQQIYYAPPPPPPPPPGQ